MLEASRIDSLMVYGRSFERMTDVARMKAQTANHLLYVLVLKSARAVLVTRNGIHKNSFSNSTAIGTGPIANTKLNGIRKTITSNSSYGRSRKIAANSAITASRRTVGAYTPARMQAATPIGSRSSNQRSSGENGRE